jgi:hypothetical protein
VIRSIRDEPRTWNHDGPRDRTRIRGLGAGARAARQSLVNGP